MLAALGLFVMGYAVFARPEIGPEPPTWRSPVFIGIAVVSIVIGVAAGPFLSMLQVVAYPLAWVITADRRQAILASSVIGLAVLFGYIVGAGFSLEAFVSGLVDRRLLGRLRDRARPVDHEHLGVRRRARTASRRAAPPHRPRWRRSSHDRGAAQERERLAATSTTRSRRPSRAS